MYFENKFLFRSQVDVLVFIQFSFLKIKSCSFLFSFILEILIYHFRTIFVSRKQITVFRSLHNTLEEVIIKPALDWTGDLSLWL